jgi:hypothetical protein
VDSNPTAQALRDTLPPILRKRITAEQAAKAIVAGIERANYRVVRPPVDGRRFRRCAACSHWRLMHICRGMKPPNGLFVTSTSDRGQDHVTTPPPPTGKPKRRTGVAVDGTEA